MNFVLLLLVLSVVVVSLFHTHESNECPLPNLCKLQTERQKPLRKRTFQFVSLSATRSPQFMGKVIEASREKIKLVTIVTVWTPSNIRGNRRNSLTRTFSEIFCFVHFYVNETNYF